MTAPDRSPTASMGIVRAGAAIAFAMGVLALLGWTFDLATLRSVRPDMIAMQPATAVALLLGAAALAAKTSSKRWRRAGTVPAVLVLVLGTYTLFTFLTGAGLVTDDLLFSEAIKRQRVPIAHPGRMAEATALCFALVGIALLVADTRRRWLEWSYSIITTAILTVMSVTLLGYLFKAPPLTGLFGLTLVALHTAIGLTALAVALVALRRDLGWASLLVGDEVGASVSRRVLPVVLAVPIVSAWLASLGGESRLFQQEIRLALVTTINIALLAGLILWISTRLNSLAAIRRTKDALIDAERRLNAVLNNASVAILLTDEKGRCSYMNAQAERMTGRSIEEAVGHPLQDIIGHDLSGARQSDGSAVGEATFTDREGGHHPVAYRVSAIHDVPSHNMGTIIEARDIRAEKEAQAKLAQAQSQLLHVSRISAMGVIGSTLAHELNQPLTSIANYLSASLRTLDSRSVAASDQVREGISRAQGSARRASEIIRRLRGFVSGGAPEMRAQDLKRIVEETLQLGTVDQRIQISNTYVDIADDARWVLADPVQVQQVLINLVRNAVDAMADVEAPSLTIVSRPAGDGMIEVAVEDVGPGPGDHTDATIFSFHSTSRTGMGLGLSICKTIIDAHGGRIGVRQGTAGGARFWFTLPSATADADFRVA